MFELFFTVLIVMLVFLGGPVSLLYFMQHHLLYHPNNIPNSYRLEYDSPFTEGFFALDGGQKIHYYYFPCLAQFSDTESVNPLPMVLYFHGNAGDLALWRNIAAELNIKTKCSVLIMDYPGFGKSDSRLARDHNLLIDMAIKAFDLAEQLEPYSKKVLYGKSLGSGVAGELAKFLEQDPTRRDKLAGLVWETPYLSLRKIGHERHSWVPKFLIRNQMSNEGLNSRSLPILILHGHDDDVIPFSHAQELASRYSQAKLISFAKGGHSNLNLYPEFWVNLQRFLRI